MNIIIDNKQYKKITEDETSFNYLNKGGETGNYKETPSSEISVIGREGDRYGKKNPHGDTISKILAPQSWFFNQGFKFNKLKSNVINENEDIDSQLSERIDFIIKRINTNYRGGRVKAEILYNFLDKIDKTNISNGDKNKLRDLIMR